MDSLRNEGPLETIVKKGGGRVSTPSQDTACATVPGLKNKTGTLYLYYFILVLSMIGVLARGGQILGFGVE